MSLPMWRRLLHRGPRPTRARTRGQSLVELALILPVLLLLFASALDLGRLFYSQITISNAAKEGALEAARNPALFDSTQPCDATTNRVICRVINEATGSFYSISPSDVSLTCSPSPCPASPAISNTVTVTVNGHFTLVTPILAAFTGGQTISISSSAVAQLGVQPDPGSAATPTPTPTPTPGATPTPTPTPTPTAAPVCTAPDVDGSIAGDPAYGTTATTFTFTAPTVAEQSGCTITYTWSFGDGASGDGPTESHQYAKKGPGKYKDYDVSLAISVSGVAESWSGTISVVVN